jgi:hypothetical protein
LFNLSTPRIAASAATEEPKVVISPIRRKRRVRKVARARAVPVKEEDVEEELATAMVEKMIEEDEKAAAMSASNSSGPGYAMIALQEQLMLLQAQVAAIQKSATTTEEVAVLSPSSFSPPPPVPPRDDELDASVNDMAPQLPESEESNCPVPPPPPEPFKTPGLRRFSATQQIEQKEEQQPKEAPLSELIRDKSRSALKGTGMPRSPGGTPLRRHSANLGSPRGLLSSALNRKFRSVRLPESPVAKLSASAAATASDEEWENVEH